MVIAERTISAAIVKPTNKAAIVNVVRLMGLSTSRLRASNLLHGCRCPSSRRESSSGKASLEEVHGGQIVAVVLVRGGVRLWRPVDDQRTRRGDPLPRARSSGLRRGAR